MNSKSHTQTGPAPWLRRCLLGALLLAASSPATRAIDRDAAAAAAPRPLETAVFDAGVNAALWYQDHEIEATWKPAYLETLKRVHPAWRAASEQDRTGRRAVGLHSSPPAHGVYNWPFPAGVTFTLGHAIQSYQNYGGTPYFHHGIDIMAPNGTDVIHRAGGQVVNIENYQPGNDLYWEVAFVDLDGYLWQYHHIDKNTIPQSIKNKFAEYQANPETGGFVTGDVYIGDIVYWTVVSYGKRFNHIHLNIFSPDSSYVNGMEFFTPVADTAPPEILSVGLLQNGALYSGNEISGNYSLYVRARDLVLDDVYWLPPYEVTFSVNGGPTESVWEFCTLPGGGDRYAYLNDYYVVPPTCGNYSCRDFYIDLGFIKDSQRVFPSDGGEHTVAVTAWDYAGNATTQTYAWTVLAPPSGTTVWFDNFESNQGWTRNLNGTDTATSGLWERANPAGTTYNGAKQLNDTVSGSYDLVTGAAAGSSASSYDVDGGVTSIWSPAITLPSSGDLTPSFYYYFAHTTSSSADYFRAKVVGTTTQTVFEKLGVASDVDAAWTINNVNISAFAGQTVRIVFEAADASTATSVVEAAVDDVLIVVNNANTAPVANPQSVSTDEDTARVITLTGSDAEGDPLTASIVTLPAHGTLTADPLSYTPAANYHGPDSFTFKVNDGQADSAPATVSITVNPVNDTPIANPQAVTTQQDTALPITLTGSDVDGDSLTFTVTSGPASGALSGTPPTLTYTPSPGYTGVDTFSFVANDGTVDSLPATVSLNVTRVNHAPVADPQNLTTPEDAPLAIGLTASDPDSDPLTYSVTSGPAHGTLSGTAPNLTYTPAANYYGADAFTFIANDGLANSAPATVSITVSPVNDPPTAFSKSVSTAEDTTLAITLTGSDVDGDPLSFAVMAAPAYGTLSGAPPNLTYTPAAHFCGADAFTFVANDGAADSAVATVTITVNPVNDPPMADPQSVTTDEDAAVTITLTGADPVEGSPLTFSIVTGPSHGTLSGTAPNLTYTPAANYHGADSFTFVANDGAANSAPATVSITINPVNDAPVATPRSITTTQDTAVSLTLTGTDVDGDPLTFAVVTPPANGTLSGTAPNLTYAPASGYTGSDSFTFVVNDGALDSSPATVTITVNPSGPVTIFEDDFESNKGWTRNPNGTDTATTGLWERADPQATSSSGTKQMGTTTSGTYDLVTGPLAGNNAGSYDIDGGVTSIRSPSFTLPSGRTLTLTFRYYLAHGNNSSSADYLRVKVVGATTSTVLQELGASNDDDAAWASFSGSLGTYAGQTVYLLIEAADASGASLVEAAIDDVKIVAQ